MQILFIHSACVAVALLLPCALCDRITRPLQNTGRTSILTSIETKKRTTIEDEAGREIEENQEIEIRSVLEKKMTKKTKIVNVIATVIGTETAFVNGNGIRTVAIAIMTDLIGTRTGIARIGPTGPTEAIGATVATG